MGDYRVLPVPFAVSQGKYLWLNNHIKDLLQHLPELQTLIETKLKHISPDFDPVTGKMNIDLDITTLLKERRGGIRAKLSIDIPDQ